MAGMKETNGAAPPLLSQSQLIAASSSPAPSDVSVSTLLDKEGTSVGCSPAPSNCSIMSEQEPLDTGSASRQSPFLSISQASPSSSFGGPFTRPDFLNTSIPDSETSSRSSLDGISLSNSKNSYRSRRRKNSSDSSGSEGSGMTMGGESLDGEETSSSRKNSKNKLSDEPLIPMNAGAPRGRIANIRRESNCSVENEAAHERLVKASQQVSSGFDDIALEKSPTASQGSDSRRRTPSVSSLGEPISIVTNSFLPNSCSPSPTRPPETNKARQCYSPSTQQMVRPNIPYSPSPSPTQSPTRQRLLRSLSPIATRTALKRRYTASAAGSGGEDSMMLMGMGDVKRSVVRTSTSPLVTDRSFPYPAPSTTPSNEFAQPQMISLSPNPSGSSFSLRRPTHSLFEGISRRDSVESNEPMEEKTDSSDQGTSQSLDESMDVDEGIMAAAIDRSLTSISAECSDVISTDDEGMREEQENKGEAEDVVAVSTDRASAGAVDSETAMAVRAEPAEEATEVLLVSSPPPTPSSVPLTAVSSSTIPSISTPGVGVACLSSVEQAALAAPLPDDDDEDDL